MNCQECQDLLQERLDDLTMAKPRSLQGHLESCKPCREWNATVSRLEVGLRRFAPPPAPPADLTNRIVSQVLADQAKARRDFQRRLVIGVAMAASLLLMVVAAYRLLQSPTPVAVAPTPPAPQPEPPASIRESVAEASSAVVNLTKRTADEAVEQGRMLLDVVGVPAPPEMTLPPSPIDPPVRSFAQAGQAISVGLEPITSSARRAFDLFLRDVPPMDSEDKPGL